MSIDSVKHSIRTGSSVTFRLQSDDRCVGWISVNGISSIGFDFDPEDALELAAAFPGSVDLA